jgi:SAM-dependent methyltransferase
MIKNKLTNILFVNRFKYIQQLSENKKVLHLGATDAPFTEDSIRSGKFLHSLLREKAQFLIGLDINQTMIDSLAKNYNITDIKYGDIENIDDYPHYDFDIIVAGEILEHLDNPGKALDCLHSISKPHTQLIITVPNAYSLKSFLRVLNKYELIHPDHTLFHSPHTLKVLLDRHGFQVTQYFGSLGGGTNLFATILNFFISLNPHLAESIGVICQPK